MEYEEKQPAAGFARMTDSDFGITDHQPKNRIASISIGGSIFSTPYISKDIIVFGCNDTFIYALDNNGEKQWSFKTNDMVFSSPTSYGESLIIGSHDGFVYSIDKSGELNWKANIGTKVYGTPMIIDGVIYVGSENGIFRAMSLDDGKEIWRIITGDEIWFSSAAVNDSIFIGNHSGLFNCISKDGEVLWKFQAGNCTISTPLVIDKSNNEVSSFNGRSFSTFPKAKGCRVVFGAGDGYTRCFDADNGRLIWKVFTNWIGGSAPFFYDKKFFLGSYDGRIYSIDLSGAIKWTFQTGNKIISSPFVSNGIVFAGSSDSNVYALDSKSGDLIWRFLTDGEIISSPVAFNNMIYLGSWDGHLYALSIKDKAVIWKFATSISYPSFITRPHTEDLKAPAKRPVEFRPTSTLKGYQVEGSVNEMGERTSMFYGVRNAVYKGNDAYRSRRDKY
ncbi:MAG: PQQ-binding-like beta-propeller repeat protein [Candidatus Aenigmatarchaeota archaeon]